MTAIEASPAGATRERSVPCDRCGTDTWNFVGRCSPCIEQCAITNERALARFHDKYVVAESGCWEWTGIILTNGYSQFAVGRSYRTSGHRFAYLAFVGPIPDGLVLDHLCRNPICVNPSHLEPVTQRENILRGTGPSAVNAQKERCSRGHEFITLPSGSRRCSECARQQHAEHVRQFRAGDREIIHGLTGYTRYGCRCDVCKRARSEWDKARRTARSQCAVCFRPVDGPGNMHPACRRAEDGPYDDEDTS